MKEPIIIWGVGLLDFKTMKEPTHHVTGLRVDGSHMVNIVVEHGRKVDVLRMSMEQAQYIGLINLSKLKPYLTGKE